MNDRYTFPKTSVGEAFKVILTHNEVRKELRALGADESTDAFWLVANTDALLREVGTACQAELRKLREELSTAHETIDAFQTASGLWRHVGNYIDQLVKQVETAERRLKESENCRAIERQMAAREIRRLSKEEAR